MAVTPRGKKWQVSVGSGKDRIRFTVDSEEEGLLIYQQELMKRKRAALGLSEQTPEEPVPTRPVITMMRLMDMACRTKWRMAADGPARNASIIVRMLGERTPVHEITRERIHELIEELYEQGNTGATINRKLSALSVMLTIAEDEGWIERAPKLPRQKESEHRIRFFNAEEENEMLAVCAKLGMDTLAEFIQFAIDTGFRRSEALNVSIRDCENGNAVLHAGETKSGRGRSVPLTTRCKEIVKRRKARGFDKVFDDLNEYQLRRQWEVLRDNVRNPGDHFLVHTLRHTCASRLAIAGENATFIQTWMGHSTILVTQRYMHLASDTLVKGVSSLENYRKKRA